MRDGVAHEANIATLIQARPVSGDSDKLENVGFLGITPSSHMVKGGPFYTTVQMGYTAEQTVEAVIRLPERVWGCLLYTSPSPRD